MKRVSPPREIDWFDVKLLPMLRARSNHCETVSNVQKQIQEGEIGNVAHVDQILKLRLSTDHFFSSSAFRRDM